MIYSKIAKELTMFSIFLQGLLLGYGACVPLGPINVLIANYALHSYKKALAMGMGAMSADIVYLLLVVFGLLKLLEGSLFLTAITFLGALFLLYIAYGTYQNRHKLMEKKALKEETLVQIYLKGFSLTFLNPYTVGFWISVGTLSSQSNVHPWVLLLGLILAILSWTTLMPLSIYKTKHLFNANVINIFSLVSTLILAGFGLLLLLKLFTA